MSAVIVLDNLTKRYGQQVVVNHLSFEISKGEIFGFLGPNGSGKTTTIKMLCGLVKPSEGTARVNGFDIIKHPEQVKCSIGYMSQQVSLFRTLTVAENLSFYSQLFELPPQQARRRIADVLEVTKLKGQEDKVAQSLSGGWRQRLALSCALIHEPPVIFLDEPTAGIDPVARRALWDLFSELARSGITFFVTTHYMDEAERCSSLGYIYNSNLIAVGKIDALRRLPIIDKSREKYLEISCNNLAAAYEFLRFREYARNVYISGDTVRMAVPTEMGTTRIEQDLTALELDAIEIRSAHMRLEDIFVTLTEQEEARRAAIKSE